MLFVWNRRLASEPHASMCSMDHIANINTTTISGATSHVLYRKYHIHQNIWKHQFTDEAIVNIATIMIFATVKFLTNVTTSNCSNFTTEAKGSQLF